MTNQTIRVVARITALPDKVETLKTVLLTLIEPTRQEPGAIRYELLQNKSDSTVFTFVEEWESEPALDVHLNSPHIQAALVQLNGLVAAAPDIGLYYLIA